MFRKSFLKLLETILPLTLCACAGIHTHPILTDNDEASNRGFRYYESSPYLLVQTDNEGGLKSQLLYLPDETKKRSIRLFNYAASISITLEFTHGVLTHGVADVDETVVPNAIISALETAAKAAIMGGNTPEGKKTPPLPGPYLFKILIKGDQVTLKGGQAEEPEINFGSAS
jgi:hypothetical protein